MFEKFGGLGKLGDFKDILEAAGIDVEDLGAEVLPQLTKCKSANDVVDVVKSLDIDFDLDELKKALKDSDIFDKDSAFGKLF